MDTYIKTKILIICTGNTCRSQMAEGFLKSLNPWLEVYSAGTKAEQHVNPYAVRAMMEMGINIGYQKPKSVDIFLDQAFDYVITVCDGAKEICPFFSGKVGKRLHISFDDPASAQGTEEEKMEVYRRVRDEIYQNFQQFVKTLY